MTVKHYEWGEVVGGSGGGGGAPAAAPFGPEESFAGTLGAATVTITFSANTKNVSIYNTDNTDYMEVSFDGGTVWIPIDPNGNRKEPVSVGSILLRTVTGTPSYTVIAVLQS